MSFCQRDGLDWYVDMRSSVTFPWCLFSKFVFPQGALKFAPVREYIMSAVDDSFPKDSECRFSFVYFLYLFALVHAKLFQKPGRCSCIFKNTGFTCALLTEIKTLIWLPNLYFATSHVFERRLFPPRSVVFVQCSLMCSHRVSWLWIFVGYTKSVWGWSEGGDKLLIHLDISWFLSGISYRVDGNVQRTARETVRYRRDQAGTCKSCPIDCFIRSELCN